MSRAILLSWALLFVGCSSGSDAPPPAGGGNANVGASTQSGSTIFNDAGILIFVNVGASNFPLFFEPFRWNFSGELATIGNTNFYISPSPNAFGANGVATADVTFTSPAAIVAGQARGTNGTEGFAAAAATLTAFDVNDNPCGTVTIDNSGMATFAFSGAISRLEVDNGAANSWAFVAELEAQSLDVSTIFFGAAFNGLGGGVSQAVVGDATFRATMTGRIATVGVPSYYIAPSPNALMVQNGETGVIEFSHPASHVSIRARGSDGSGGFAAAAGEIRALDPLGGELSSDAIPNGAFTTFHYRGQIGSIEVTNSAAGSIAIVGQVSAQGNTVHTFFDGAHSGVVFADEVGAPSLFSLTAGRVIAQFDGEILAPDPGLRIAPSPHAFGIDGAGSSVIRFTSPVGIVSGRARGGGADVGLPPAVGQVIARDVLDNVIGTFDLPDDAFGSFGFRGAIASLEITNSVAGSVGVIGELSATSRAP